MVIGMVQALACEKNFLGTIIQGGGGGGVGGRAIFLPWSNLLGDNFLGDTIPGGNFPAGNIPCLEYKQDHFSNKGGNNY